MLPLIVTLLFACPEQFQVRAYTGVVGGLARSRFQAGERI